MAASNTREAQEKLADLRANLAKVIEGKEECIDLVTIALVAGGSVLMEDVPGVGKTTFAKALAQSIDASFNRIQFTPDLLPADILGTSIYNPKDGSFDFREGPIFCNILLADEINRASPRTQSALLEAMSESQATIEGVRRPLPAPFLVLATQNPVEYHGTYPLPEAQLDRFLVQINLGYPDAESEVRVLYAQATAHPLDSLSAAVTLDDVRAMQEAARAVRVDESLSHYIVAIVNATRADDRLRLGASPRGSLMLFRAAQAAAFAAGRDYVLPDDVQHMARHVLPHRLILTPKAKYSGLAKGDVISEVIGHVPTPA
jgi:MoxR-like ATPase